MLPIVAALVGGLMKNGLGLLSKVIEKKGKKFIEDKTGVDLSNPDLTEEQLLELKKFEMENEQELMRLALEDKELDMKSDEMYLRDVQSSRDMQQTALTQEDKFAKRFVYYYAIVITLVTFVYIFFITFGTIPKESIRFADTILGFLLGTIISAIVNFFYGSSSSSRDKDKALQDGIIKKINGGK